MGDQRQLQDWYNAMDFPSQIRAGRVFVRTIYRQPVHHPFKAISFRDEYADGQNRLLAEVHYYQKPDGTKTEPDPKILFRNGVTYILAQD